MKFNINDKVRLINDPAMTGTITKCFVSSDSDRAYMISYGVGEGLVHEEDIELDNHVSYTFEFEYLDNVVIAIYYELTDTSKTELGRGHGHIIHEGAKGIAQAASYALKKLYEKMNNGKLF